MVFSVSGNVLKGLMFMWTKAVYFLGSQTLNNDDLDDPLTFPQGHHEVQVCAS